MKVSRLGVLWKVIAIAMLISSVSVAVIYAMSYRVAHADNREPQRYVASIASSEFGPSFSLNSNEGVVRILSYYHIPRLLSESTYEPDIVYPYELVIDVFDSGQLIGTERIAHETRKTKTWNEVTGDVLQPSSYAVGIEIGEPADPRLIDLDLQQYAGPDRSFRIRLESDEGLEDASASVIVFRRFARLEDTVKERSSSNARQREVVGRRMGLRPWTVLTDDEYASVLERGWRRKTTLSESPSRVLFTSDYALTEFEAKLAFDEISPGYGAAYTVVGPTTFSTMLIGESEGRVKLDIEQMRLKPEESHTRFERNVILAPLASAFRPAVRDERAEKVVLPEGVFTIVVRANSRVKALSWVDRESALLSENPRSKIAEQQFQIRKDTRRFTWWRLSSNPTTFSLNAPGRRTNDVVKISLRRRTVESLKVQYRFPDVGVEGELESATPMTTMDWVEEDYAPRTVSGQDVFKFSIPDGAESIELVGVDEVLVAVDVLSLAAVSKVTYLDEYDKIATSGWRHAPVKRTPWFRIRPDDLANAAPISLVGTTRLEPKEVLFSESVPPAPNVAGTGAFRSLTPLRRSTELWESDVAANAKWFETRSTKCQPNETVLVEVFSPKLRGLVRVFWNGQLEKQNRIRVKRQQVSFRTNSVPGVLKIDAPETSRVFTTCRPSEPTTGYRVRLVTKQTRLQVEHGEETTWVNAIVYAQSPIIESAKYKIDSGNPPASGSPAPYVVPAVGEKPVVWTQTEAFIANAPFRRLSMRGRVSIPIGGNWESGRRKVEVELPKGTWVRYFGRE